MTWPTHTVTNQAPPLQDYNLFGADPALREAVDRAGAAWAVPDLTRQGEELGTAASFALGHLANQYPPLLRSFDARGHRLDEIEFHPAWHGLMADIARRGLHTGPWAQARHGAHAARAAGFILQTQIEAGSMCPTTMTYGAIPALARDAGLVREALSVLLRPEYDPRDLPLAQKRGGLIGMGMTEKQGGSDLRTNTTRAEPDGAGGWRLTGHKWFFSAPQCDAHLVLAQTPGGLSCFFVPRWVPDGSKNPVLIQRLKDKLGNRSNASSEVEFQGAWGHLLGAEGRGVPTILEMGTYTRLDCVLGTTGLMRQALSQAVHYARHRLAFGAALIDQPLMRNVLADMALEVEAAIALAMRLAEAFDAQHDEAQSLLRRLLTPAAKFRICKRGAELAAEAMEVLGGNGYVEDDVQARIYREMPVNSIWEGSGNVMCLDVLRALGKNPRTLDALMAELAPAQGRNAHFDAHVRRLAARLRQPEGLQAEARSVSHDIVLAMQAALLLQHAPQAIAEPFCASRLGGEWGGGFGTLSTTCDSAAILDRALLS
ncbi:isovaleryl-CoA dehydrogenase [Thiomonas bhubaneswarensis]|uniref:Acyl-CoA dehydrogenase related to the alkylation response protein AidB n=1 Tax=Thiomonas bhubaneswarensis TaxID=339866 RepID=A0A0K6I951_9BURK|nr:isovaleryl-CoA dehydrogenase [Thiomonas bhubaneswarensis]CUA99644.1 Acyl-CoA dehydrogenase related to the alkylation response protein AidB [Thiomonas bhubaneswarensis]